MSRTSGESDGRRWQVRLAIALGLATFVVVIAGALLRVRTSGFTTPQAADQLLAALLLGCVGLAVIGAAVNGYHDGPPTASVALVLSTVLGFGLAVAAPILVGIESHVDAPAVPVLLTYLAIAVVLGAIAWLVGFGARFLFGPPVTEG